MDYLRFATSKKAYLNKELVVLIFIENYLI